MAQRLRNRRRNQVDEDSDEDIQEDNRMTAAEQLEAALNDPGNYFIEK